MSDDLTPQGAAAVRLAVDVVRLKKERDRARGMVVALEQQVARIVALADEWDARASRYRNEHLVPDARSLRQRASELRAALEAL